jgi:hypothetical protein
MTEIITYCPSCGWDTPLAQLHGLPGGCPDVTDGNCPEWYCLSCGTAMILGALPAPDELSAAVRVRDRVA